MNWHEILGVGPNATTAEIKTAYRKKCVEYHPDKCKLPNAAAKFIEVNNAYHALTDPTYKPSAPPPPPRPKPQPKPRPQAQPKWNDEPDLWSQFGNKSQAAEEKRINDSLWARFKNDFEQPRQYFKPYVPPKPPPEIDLWAQTITESEKFTKDYWNEYRRLRSSMAYEEPDKFWDALDEWTKERRKKK